MTKPKEKPEPKPNERPAPQSIHLGAPRVCGVCGTVGVVGTCPVDGATA